MDNFNQWKMVCKSGSYAFWVKFCVLTYIMLFSPEALGQPTLTFGPTESYEVKLWDEATGFSADGRQIMIYYTNSPEGHLINAGLWFKGVSWENQNFGGGGEDFESGASLRGAPIRIANRYGEYELWAFNWISEGPENVTFTFGKGIDTYEPLPNRDYWGIRVKWLDPITVTLQGGEERLIAKIVYDPSPTNQADLIFHRLVATGVSNPSAAAAAPLEAVRDVGKLNAQPQVKSGMVADGVTPLLIHCVFKPLTTATSVSLSLTAKSGGSSPLAFTQLYPSSPLLPVGEKEVWFQVKAIAPEDLRLAQGAVELSVEAKLTGIGQNSATATFRIRKPPLVLVHGYNTDSLTWTADFHKTITSSNRPSDFILPVDYGVIDKVKETVTKGGTFRRPYKDNSGNTFGSLTNLAMALSRVLEKTVEKQDLAWRKEWAFTKYDIVGHSQGGVLTRMLCSKNAAQFGAQSFKSASNYNRGRFNRVITIGSPHNGSRLVHYLYRLKQLRPGIWETISDISFIENLLQRKFILGPTSQIATINDKTHECDPDAKFWLITTTINNGLHPGSPPIAFGALEPLSYLLTKLGNRNPLSGGKTAGEKVLPNGSDGCVDLDSQGTGYPVLDNNTAHAIPERLFGVPTGAIQTGSPLVAREVTSRLDGPITSLRHFRLPTMVSPSELNEIEEVVANWERGETHDISENSAGTQSQVPSRDIGLQSLGPSPAHFRFQLDPPANKPLRGSVTWFAQVFGTNGVSQDGIVCTPDASNSRKVTVQVSPTVRGQVVLYASYDSTSGRFIVYDPVTVVTQNGGATLARIEIDPPAIALPPSAEPLNLQVWGVFSDDQSYRLHVSPGDVTSTSSNPGVATVDKLEVSLVQTGSATIHVSYHGMSAQVSVTASDDALLFPPANMAPVIIFQPQAQTVAAGASASFSVIASGTAPLTYQWRKDGTNIDGSTNAIHTITNVGTSDAGSYTLIVSDAMGSVLSSNAVLTVTAGAGTSVPGAPIANVTTAAAGDSFVASWITVSGATGYRLDVATSSSFASYLSAYQNLDVGNNQIHLVLGLNPGTTYYYRVRAYNSAGIGANSATITVTTTPSTAIPVITTHPINQTVTVGESVSFIVTATGTAPLTYQWLKNGANITGAVSATYSIASAQATDAGSYTVLISNSGGSVTSDAATLTILPAKTAPLKHPADNNPVDNRITITEITAYASAWKSGKAWTIEPNPIPVAYLTRAASIWKSGELYHYDATLGAPPLWWVSGANLSPPSLRGKFAAQSSNLGAAMSYLPVTYTPGTAFTAKLTVNPAAGVTAYAVEETLPTGWTVAGVTDAGLFDAPIGKIKWGPYFDDRARTFQYSATSPANAMGPAAFRGLASFDGVDAAITGARQVTTGTSTAPPGAAPRLLPDYLTSDSNNLIICFEAVPGHLYELERSEDLQTWNRTSLNVKAVNSTATIRYLKDNLRQQFFRVRLAD